MRLRPRFRAVAVRALLATHLVLCIAFAASDRLVNARSGAAAWLTAFGSWTGAATQYGFFAPGVPSARRVRVRGLCGAAWIDVRPPDSSAESQLRVSTIVSLTMLETVEKPVAASWAAYAFGRLPCAQIVLVEVDYYRIPPMADYARGELPRWELLHVMPFARSMSVL